MFNYQDLKKSSKSSNGMPTWDSFLPIVLSIVADGQKWESLKLKRAAVDAIFGLPADMKIEKQKNTDYHTIAETRAGWALSMLKNAGLLDRPKKAEYIINENGLKVFQEHGIGLTYQFVSSLPVYKAYIRKRDEAKIAKTGPENQFDSNIDSNITDLAPEEQMTTISEDVNASVATELLERILENDPNFFESLVLNLLVKMGYQGQKGNSIVTKRSNDGGIDGIINQDPLGTQTVYIQAKRYAPDNKIGRPVIQTFKGALEDAGGGKGVFITTSDFSKEARESADKSNVVLVNGNQLVRLMLQYKIGVRVKQSFELYDIDEEFFEI